MFYSLKKYHPFIEAGIKKSVAYRINFLLFRLGDIMGAVVTYFLWSAIFASSSNNSIGGFTVQEMSIYVFLSFFSGIVTNTGSSVNIGQEVKDGSISMRLLKPVSFIATYLFEEIGSKMIQIGMLSIPILGGLILFQLFHPMIVPLNGLNFLFFLISIFLAYLINFYFNVCFGFAAFVLQNLWGANVMKTSIVAFMSGTLIPLAFFPASIGNILQFFPFASFIYTPVMIYLGKYSGDKLIQVLLLQIFWWIVFYIFSKIIWSIVINKLNIQGG
ncbi:Daunorubicin resistance transmembrane protein [Lactococcus lactis subsp. lactis]|uniref:ABC transporter permease n=1 Tax=Lactococcus lactis TaxID=1358 RepID=UPI00071D6253|nr:ABC-2 family transporter protein [Lactococcus lactis]KST91462.1 Daunorubicin resistance transmembrane protein [Lactococcus lactis subsp. lactis]